MKLNFSTDALSARLRPQFWNEVVCRHCIPANSCIGNPRKFVGRFSARSIGSLEISRMSSSPHVWERTQAQLRRDPSEAFVLALMKSGTGCLMQSGRVSHTKDGDLVLYDGQRPFIYELAPASLLLLRIPRKQLLYRAPNADQCTAVNFMRDKPTTGLLVNIVQESASIDLTDDLPSIAHAQFAGSLLDLLGAAILVQMTHDLAPCSQHHKLLERAKTFIDSRLDDPFLTVEHIASAVGVSGRTLMRIFAEQGITPMRWVWRRRCDAAYCSLKEGRAKRVTDAAFRYGFNDLSHFSRIFKSAYGHSPRDLLMRGQH